MKRINLIPPESRRLPAASRIRKYILKSGILKVIISISLLSFSVFIYNVSSMSRSRLKISLLKAEIKQLEAELEHTRDTQAQIKREIEAIEEENKYIQKRLSFLEDTKKEAVKWSDVLFVLNKFTPPDLWLSKISLKKDAITINGTTLNNAKVSNFMLKLDETGHFRQTSFNFTQKKKDKPEEAIIDFEVTTHLAR